MQIAKDTVVYLQYKMHDTDGQLLDSTEEPMSYLHGGYDGIFPLVEEALHGKAVGDKLEVTLEPDDGFGDYDAELVRTEDRSIFPADIEVGMHFESDDPDSDEVLYFTVTDIEGDTVVLDGNHPLAGKTIRFSCEVVNVRPATGEELDHGHVHDGHHHH